MKKHISKLLLVMMVLTMAFSLAACGSEKNDSKTNDSQGSVSNTNSQSGSEDQSEADDASAQEEEKEYASVEDYVKSDEVQYVLDLLAPQLEGSGMSLDILAEGDKMVYSYKMENIEKASLTDEQIASVGESVEADSATFQETADQVKELVDAEAPALVIRYLDANGEEIYSKEFPAQ